MLNFLKSLQCFNQGDFFNFQKCVYLYVMNYNFKMQQSKFKNKTV